MGGAWLREADRGCLVVRVDMLEGLLHTAFHGRHKLFRIATEPAMPSPTHHGVNEGTLPREGLAHSCVHIERIRVDNCGPGWKLLHVENALEVGENGNHVVELGVPLGKFGCEIEFLGLG
jgi:hypothetical protein